MKQGRIVESQGVCYYKDDKLHRDDDLPAVERDNGAKAWFKNGERHRLRGPAVILNDGWTNDLYFLFGKKMSRDNWENSKERKIAILEEVLSKT